MQQTSQRLRSIDIFRAVTMLFMIFVNDVSGVTNIPAWIDHVEADEDGLGFADTVFPAFLFIVGLSVPIAMKKRLEKGDSWFQVSRYILTRSLALIVMGFFHVNLENYNPESSLPAATWQILLTLSFFLIWLDYSPKISARMRYLLIGCGIAILVVLALIYKGGTPGAPASMQPHWWGILGIIGWAYLVCAIIYLPVRSNITIIIFVLLLLMVINVASHTGLITSNIPVLGDASSASLVMCGIFVSEWYTKMILERRRGHFIIACFALGIAFIAAGIFIRPFAGGISKIHSTPAWVLICSGLSAIVFSLFAWLVDIRGKQHWFNIIKPAGTSTLTCYLLPYLLYGVYQLFDFRYFAFFNEGVGGILRSFLVAFGLVLLTGFLEKKHLTLKI